MKKGVQTLLLTLLLITGHSFALEVEVLTHKSDLFYPVIKIRRKAVRDYLSEAVFKDLIVIAPLTIPFRMPYNTLVTSIAGEYWINPKEYKSLLKVDIPTKDIGTLETQDYLKILTKAIKNTDNDKLKKQLISDSKEQKYWRKQFLSGKRYIDNRLLNQENLLIEKEAITVIVANPEGSRIEINDEYIGDSPVSVNLKDFTSGKYRSEDIVIAAYPQQGGNLASKYITIYDSSCLKLGKQRISHKIGNNKKIYLDTNILYAPEPKIDLD